MNFEHVIYVSGQVKCLLVKIRDSFAPTNPPPPLNIFIDWIHSYMYIVYTNTTINVLELYAVDTYM